MSAEIDEATVKVVDVKAVMGAAVTLKEALLIPDTVTDRPTASCDVEDVVYTIDVPLLVAAVTVREAVFGFVSTTVYKSFKARTVMLIYTSVFWRLVKGSARPGFSQNQK